MTHQRQRWTEEYTHDDMDWSWLGGYSIKFQGCHHVTQWNDEASMEDQVRVMTKRLVRFRLCPTDQCSSSTHAAGCDSNYGDYVIDLNTFLDSYYLYVGDPYTTTNADFLTGIRFPNNVANDDDELLDHDVDVECVPFVPSHPTTESGAEGDAHQTNNHYSELYIGPYCAEQGGAVFLGLFQDNRCTNFADSRGGRGSALYKRLTGGQPLPYASESVIGMDCVPCGPDEEAFAMCEMMYMLAGKCETNLHPTTTTTTTTTKVNENACNYMEGIKIRRVDGKRVVVPAKPRQSVSIAILVLAAVFVLLALCVCWLQYKIYYKPKTKYQSIQRSAEEEDILPDDTLDDTEEGPSNEREAVSGVS